MINPLTIALALFFTFQSFSSQPEYNPKEEGEFREFFFNLEEEANQEEISFIILCPPVTMINDCNRIIDQFKVVDERTDNDNEQLSAMSVFLAVEEL